MTAIWVRSPCWRTTMTRSTASRRARNSDSVMIGGRRRPDSRPSRRRCRLASSRVEPLTASTSPDGSSAVAERRRARARRCSAGRPARDELGVAAGPGAAPAAPAAAGRGPSAVVLAVSASSPRRRRRPAGASALGSSAAVVGVIAWPGSTLAVTAAAAAPALGGRAAGCLVVPSASGAPSPRAAPAAAWRRLRSPAAGISPAALERGGRNRLAGVGRWPECRR